MHDNIKADGFKITMALICTALNTTGFPSDPQKIEGLAQLHSGDLAIWFASYEDKAKAIAKSGCQIGQLPLYHPAINRNMASF
jgi:hypothetical protein